MTKTKQFLKGFEKGFKSFGHNISILVNTIILSLVYIIGVGITSIIAKISGKKFLDMKLSNKESYWSDLNLKEKPIEEYYRQF